MSQSTKVILIGLIVLAAGTILILGTFLIASWFIMPTRSATMYMPPDSFNYSTRGERIYLTGTSESGPPISAQMPGVHRLPGGDMGCATCHGPDASGGTVQMMMTSMKAPDIRWEHLVEAEHHEEEGEEHLTYTVESFKRAVTEGVDPSGEDLHWMMPRWEMADAQLDDLIAYLQTLD